jgi:hypothetical protein
MRLNAGLFENIYRTRLIVGRRYFTQKKIALSVDHFNLLSYGKAKDAHTMLRLLIGKQH